VKLRTKLLLSELPLALVLATVSVYAVHTVDQLGLTATKILRDNHLSVVAAQRMEAALDEADDALVGELDSSVAPIVSTGPMIAAFEKALVVQEGNITEFDQHEDVATTKLRDSFERWKKAVRDVETAPDVAARRETYSREIRPLSREVRLDAASIVTINQVAMLNKSSETSRLAGTLSEALAVVSVAALAFVVLLGFVIADRITRPLTRLAETARRIGEGDLGVTLESPGGDDEIATLVGEFGRMLEHLRTFRKSSLGELLEATEAAQAAIDSLMDPVLTFNEDGSFRRANEASRRLLGIDPDATHPVAALPAEVREAVDRVRDRVLRGKGPQSPRALEDAVPVLVDGRPRYFQPLATPIYSDVKGSIVGVTVLLRDVTSLRRADELKNDLLATVAHELRTPLTSIRMGLHLCLEEVVGPLTEKQRELMHSAREDAERLHSIVEGILSVSKIEAGTLVGRRRATTPRALVQAAIGPFRPQAADRRIKLDSQAVEAPLIEVDPDSIVLVLNNMIANAIRSTPEEGSIQVTAVAEDGAVRFEVKDTGSGIAPEHRPRLFEKFYRVPGSPPGGTGLGLSIARDVVFAHEGEIGVDSEVGKGSRFWFRIPVRASLMQSDEWVPGVAPGA
jgi:signal transduction histidine kinase